MEDMSLRMLVHKSIHRWQYFEDKKSLNLLKEELKKSCVVTNQSITTLEFRFCPATLKQKFIISPKHLILNGYGVICNFINF